MTFDRLNPLGVSVLIPVYFRDTSFRHLRWLRRALESARDQSYPGPYEILVVDDGSPTPVSEHAAELGAVADAVTWVRCARNGGIVTALNVGLRHARHPLVARLDADDAWCDGKIEKQLALFAADPDLTIVGTGMTRVDEQDNVIDHHIRKGDWNGILRCFVEVGCPFPHGSVVARTDIYRLLGGYPYDASTRHCEDFALWSTWLRFFKPAMIEESLYRYTVSNASISLVHQESQSTASGVIHGRFLALNLVDRLPAALQQLANVLGVRLIDAGALAYAMHRYHASVRLPPAAIEPLRVILGDRDLETAPTALSPSVLLPAATGLRETDEWLPITATAAR